MHFLTFTTCFKQKFKAVDDVIWLNKSAETWQLGTLIQVPLPMRPLPMVAHVFTFKEMLEATGNFSSDNLLGEGGFGQVYRGILSGGKTVAIKQMNPALSIGTQGEREFRVEVDILSRLSHPNLVRLIGYCADRTHRMLVYEFMTNGNLQEHLNGVLRQKMDWQVRLRIALGAAKALEYLHSGPATGNPIIHRDFKSSNILLDENFSPKVSDFGLAKLVPFGNKTYVSTRVLGTFGYFDPQYTATGRLTLKSDVYSFGVVLLEVLTGRRALDDSQCLNKQNLVSQVRDSLQRRNKLRKIVDLEISPESFSMHSIKKFADLASRCVREDDSRRPTIAECVRELEILCLQAMEHQRTKI